MLCGQTIHSPQWPFSTLKSSGDILCPVLYIRHESYDAFQHLALNVHTRNGQVEEYSANGKTENSFKETRLRLGTGRCIGGTNDLFSSATAVTFPVPLQDDWPNVGYVNITYQHRRRQTTQSA